MSRVWGKVRRYVAFHSSCMSPLRIVLPALPSFVDAPTHIHTHTTETHRDPMKVPSATYLSFSPTTLISPFGKAASRCCRKAV